MDQGQWAWFHVASLGEFEQARPLIMAYKKHFPEDKILLTFFSPSGYEIKKNFIHADCICYLPWDSIQNVNRFLDFCNVKLAIFVKYEFWPNFFNGLHKRKIPVYSVSSIFRPQQLFFRWYGVEYRKLLYGVKHYFVQNDLSKKLLNNIGINAVSVNGDTRVDRVYQMVKQENKLEIMNDFTSGIKCFVAGSTWPEDHNLIEDLLKKNMPLKIVIVPHEVSRKVIGNLDVSAPFASPYSRNLKALLCLHRLSLMELDAFIEAITERVVQYLRETEQQGKVTKHSPPASLSRTTDLQLPLEGNGMDSVLDDVDAYLRSCVKTNRAVSISI